MPDLRRRIAVSEGGIRPAGLADLPVVQRIIDDVYAKYIERIGRKPAPMLDDYRQRIAEHAVWVYGEGDAIVGVVVLLPAADHLLLDNVAVAATRQGHGVGRQLIAFAEAEARRRGYHEIRLYTHQKMYENVAMYPRLGYEETGRGSQAGFERVFFRKRLG